MDQDTQALKTFITLFLQLNAEPADAQVHALASALGADKESLEAVMYKMLADTNKPVMAATHSFELGADSQEVLDGDYNPDTTPLPDLALNDGSTGASDLGFQDELNDDGVAEEDLGVGVGSSQDVLTDDGVPVLTPEDNQQG